MLHEKNLKEKNLLQIMTGIPDFKKGWDQLQTELHDQFAMQFSIIRGLPNAAAGDTGTNDRLSIRVTRFGKSSGPTCNTLIFIEDLSGNETLDVADQLYTDSLEILMQEKNRELELIQEQLISSEKKAAMIETAGAVAHELRQPMTTIIGTIDLLNTKPAIRENPTIEKRFQIIQKQCLRMAETIKQMEELVEYKTKQYVKNSLIIDLEESSQKKQRRGNVAGAAKT
jgi:signal transduction histidine kinase